jgi:integrase
LKTGREVTFPKLTELADHWDRIPRRKAPDGQYANQCRLRLQRFAAWVAEHQPDATEFVAVKPETAKAFMETEAKREVSPKTWNDMLKLLRATFKHLHPHLSDGSNPFHGLVTKATETVNREPFTVEELKAITESCAGDDFIRPIIVAGMCTAMRRGDCCLLKWADVDLTAGFLSVKTAKTGETVDIPIFPMLAEELTKAKAAAGASEFCFPEAAQMYRNSPDGITWRVKQVIARALESMVPAGRPALPPPANPDEVRARVEAFQTRLGDSPRAPKIDALQQERENGQRRASLNDFHSFRVTWITLALAAGVPLELVQRVTGHRTVPVVLKHYFRPGREDFRQVLFKAMPRLLSQGPVSSPCTPQIREIVEGMTGRTWRADRARLLALLPA